MQNFNCQSNSSIHLAIFILLILLFMSVIYWPFYFNSILAEDEFEEDEEEYWLLPRAHPPAREWSQKSSPNGSSVLYFLNLSDRAISLRKNLQKAGKRISLLSSLLRKSLRVMLKRYIRFFYPLNLTRAFNKWNIFLGLYAIKIFLFFSLLLDISIALRLVMHLFERNIIMSNLFDGSTIGRIVCAKHLFVF